MTTVDDGRRFRPEVLRCFATEVLVAAGAVEEDADVCSKVLVSADLAGADTHGVARLGRYAEDLLAARTVGGAVPEVVQQRGGVTVLEAHHGLGPPCLQLAVDLAVDTADRYGVGITVVRGATHAGALGWYTERAADAGCFALVLTGTAPMVAPTHGAAPFLGTNPIAYAIPATGAPIAFDAATSVVPRGRVESFQRSDRQLPSGWATDSGGRPAVDSDEVLAGLVGGSGHSLLPLGGTSPGGGGHKGFGLGLLVELLCGPLAAAGPTTSGGVGQFVLCLGLDVFGGDVAVARRVAALADQLRAVTPLDVDVPVRAPGDRHRDRAVRRARDGIPLPWTVVTELDRLAVLTDVVPPVPSDVMDQEEP